MSEASETRDAGPPHEDTWSSQNTPNSPSALAKWGMSLAMNLGVIGAPDRIQVTSDEHIGLRIVNSAPTRACIRLLEDEARRVIKTIEDRYKIAVDKVEPFPVEEF
jgi:hypothetical protein